MAIWLKKPSLEMHRPMFKSQEQHVAELFIAYLESHPIIPADPFSTGISKIDFSGADFDCDFERNGRNYSPYVFSDAAILKNRTTRNKNRKHSWLTREKLRRIAKNRSKEMKFNRLFT